MYQITQKNQKHKKDSNHLHNVRFFTLALVGAVTLSFLINVMYLQGKQKSSEASFWNGRWGIYPTRICIKGGPGCDPRITELPRISPTPISWPSPTYRISPTPAQLRTYVRFAGSTDSDAIEGYAFPDLPVFTTYTKQFTIVRIPGYPQDHYVIGPIVVMSKYSKDNFSYKTDCPSTSPIPVNGCNLWVTFQPKEMGQLYFDLEAKSSISPLYMYFRGNGVANPTYPPTPTYRFTQPWEPPVRTY